MPDPSPTYLYLPTCAAKSSQPRSLVHLRLCCRLCAPVCPALLAAQAKLYEGTKQQRGRFKGFIGELPPKEDMPVVAVVTFAAPRVGDASYADRLGERTVMNPWDVREPFNTARGFWGFWRTLPMIVAVLIRDHIPQVCVRVHVPVRVCVCARTRVWVLQESEHFKDRPDA